LAKLLRAITATASFAFLLFFLGCGAGLVQVGTTPSISQVVPQTIAAGSKNLTIKVSGTNFTSESVILWNGNALSFERTCKQHRRNTFYRAIAGSEHCHKSVFNICARGHHNSCKRSVRVSAYAVHNIVATAHLGHSL